MNSEEIKSLLSNIKDGTTTVDQGLEILKSLPFDDLGFAKIDNHREIRVGYPEVIYCQGKAVEHVTKIIEHMNNKNVDILATRASEEMYNEVVKSCPNAEYNKLARTIVIKKTKREITDTTIAIVTGGTSDIAVAEEAAVTAEIFGNRVDKFYDIGVAGIHRLFGNLERIRAAKVVIAVAGMEGALASVVGGLVDKPVIAVPTSIGYGANFSGLAALLSMLNSCASGISVVNIDNGFGAGYLAGMINKL